MSVGTRLLAAIPLHWTAPFSEPGAGKHQSSDSRGQSKRARREIPKLNVLGMMELRNLLSYTSEGI